MFIPFCSFTVKRDTLINLTAIIKRVKYRKLYIIRRWVNVNKVINNGLGILTDYFSLQTSYTNL